MTRGWIRAPTDRERKTCGPSLEFPIWTSVRVRLRPATGRAGDLAHFPARCEAVYAGKSVHAGPCCRVFKRKPASGLDPGREPVHPRKRLDETARAPVLTQSEPKLSAGAGRALSERGARCRLVCNRRLVRDQRAGRIGELSERLFAGHGLDQLV